MSVSWEEYLADIPGCRCESYAEYCMKYGKIYHMSAIIEFHPAFSRDQKEKVYVQNKIDDDSSRVYEDLIKKGGYFFLCGQACQGELDIKTAIYSAIAAGKNISMENAKEMFENLAEAGRYCPEVY
ncbi:NADPH cytochrome P450, putative [Perkinsus marinus ATCC 50983]|uniref:NADPH--hemoprotein reductase n=1 Tax=Perkinsus marinus (strain ATCC 50983 / TXsc) TaxID=423536 RepID=C5LZL4_PERM5|nr:NADPH cytochrome P450, putative [Perkinsus marinus ATCC 50983]EEQ97829.1 NADPH cytochrome P450, putative [Perkinsus marinus ATCC 50983]|eukprot:XP_002765112.1 NADPH cytochrome P450, putative [Perkinsus marinus ATCC 50983]